MRAVKTPDEIERIAAACAVADRALAALLPEIRAGVTEHDLALRLEWLIRTGGAEALAFDVACLAGPEAALPHGAPGDRPVLDGAVLLFDFGAQVEGYRSDMTRTLFVGEPAERDLRVYELVAPGPAGSDRRRSRRGCRAGAGADGRELDAVARGVIDEAGTWPAYGHGLGHGIGLATHEEPSLSRSAPETPLPSPTVFSVEPGIYLEGETGVRIEDLVHLDAARGVVELLTRFPRDVIIAAGLTRWRPARRRAAGGGGRPGGCGLLPGAGSAPGSRVAGAAATLPGGRLRSRSTGPRPAHGGRVR